MEADHSLIVTDMPESDLPAAEPAFFVGAYGPTHSLTVEPWPRWHPRRLLNRLAPLFGRRPMERIVHRVEPARIVEPAVGDVLEARDFGASLRAYGELFEPAMSRQATDLGGGVPLGTLRSLSQWIEDSQPVEERLFDAEALAAAAVMSPEEFRREYERVSSNWERYLDGLA